MKRIIAFSVLLLYFLLAGFDSEPAWYEYMPVFMQRSEMEKSVKLEAARGIQNPGKIYVKGQYILINEKYQGIHLIDNSNPESPDNVAFIQIDGCIDMAVKDNVIYADNAVDLIAISINPEMTGIEVTGRIKNVFPELTAPDGRELTYREKNARPENSILVRWEQQ